MRRASLLLLLLLVPVVAACGSKSAAPSATTSAKGGKPAGLHSDGKAPLESPNFHAKVVIGDPNDPRRQRTTFDAGAIDPASKRPLATVLGGWFNAKPAAASARDLSSADLPDESSLCDDVGGDCVVFTYGWEAISPDQGISSSIWCPSDHPYLYTLYDTAGQYPDDSANPWYEWGRDHWTITLWNFNQDYIGDDNYESGVSYSGQNWNTVFGDTWHYAMFIPCTDAYTSTH